MKKIALLLIFALALVWELSAQNEPEFITHKVQKDETVWGISQEYGVKPDVIYKYNPKAKTKLFPGDILKIPRVLKSANYRTHIVQKGEGLFSIARDNDISVDELKKLNKSKIKNNTIHPGQELIVGIGNSKTTSKKKKPVKKKLKYSRDEEVEEGEKKIEHTVQKGESIASIKRKYGVSMANIKEWNNLSSDKIVPGQKLAIYVLEDEYTPNQTYETLQPGQVYVHTVGKGETIFSVQNKYNVTKEEVQIWNNLPSKSILAGQNLKIYKPERIEHIVSAGQTVGSIAQFYTNQRSDLKTVPGFADKLNRQIRIWNALKDPTVKTGQTLVLYMPKGPLKAEDVVVPAGDNHSMPISYTVKMGDNLETIAKKYHVSGEEIQHWNKNVAINPGQVLKIHEPERDSYVVKQGEDLNKIAQNFAYLYKLPEYKDEIIEQLSIWNNLTSVNVPAGTILTVYKPTGPLPKSTKILNTPNTNNIATPTTNTTVNNNTNNVLQTGQDANGFSIPILHPVKEGENISTLSTKYNVGRSEIGYWNNRTWEQGTSSINIKIYAGEDLYIHLPKKDSILARRGQTLEQIAEIMIKKHPNLFAQHQYRIQKQNRPDGLIKKFVKKIKIWNKLPNNQLSIGQKLIFWIPTGPLSKTGLGKHDNYIPPSKKELRSGTVIPKTTQGGNPSGNLKSPNTNTTAKGKKITYTVKKGETLYAIASKHKVKMNQIQEWNGLQNHFNVNEGQKLTIYTNANPTATNVTKQPTNTIQNTPPANTGNPFDNNNNTPPANTGNPFDNNNNTPPANTGNPFDNNNNTPPAQPKTNPFENKNTNKTEPVDNNPVKNTNTNPFGDNTNKPENKVESTPVVNSTPSTSKVTVMKGLAEEIKGVSSTGRFVAFAGDIPQGTLITVKNVLNGESVSAVVIGPIPSEKTNGVILQLSPEAFKRLQSANKQVQVELSYE